MPTFIKHELAREAQIELVHAGQALKPCGLKDDGLSDWNTLSIRHAEGRRGLDGEARIVLEVDASPELPGQFVGAIHFENVGRVEVKIVVVAVDVVVGIRKVVAGGFVGEAAAEGALLSLNCEAAENLPFVGEAFDGSELDGVVRVVVELREVGYGIAELAEFGSVGRLKAEEGRGLVGEGIDDWAAVQGGDGNIVRQSNRGVLCAKEVFLCPVVGN